mgnify:CR=1 FL=1
MFDHLVESGSHSEDIKRKGSFLAGFAIFYLVMIFTVMIVGILIAPAYIDQQTLELTALIAPVPVPQVKNEVKQEAKPEKVELWKNVDVRKELIADVSRADLVPKEISAKASDIPPVRKGVVTMVGSGNSNAVNPIAPGAGTGQIISAPTRVGNQRRTPAAKSNPRAHAARADIGWRAQRQSGSSGYPALSGDCQKRACRRCGPGAGAD